VKTFKGFSEGFITNYLVGKFLTPETFFVAKNMYFKKWESDFLYIGEDGYSNEIEVKVSLVDFKADFKKLGFIRSLEKDSNGYLFKHNMIKDGLYGLKTFSFACPEGVIERGLIPDYCGFYEVTNRGQIIEVITPPILDNPTYVSAKETKKIFHHYKYRLLNYDDQIKIEEGVK